MQMTQLIRKMGRNDARLLGRDSFLLFLSVYIVIIAIVLRLGLPWLNTYLADNAIMPGDFADVPFSTFFPVLIAFLGVFVGGLMVGSIFGFLLLDEKDDNTITAMLVTPIPLRQYLMYRIGLPAFLAFLTIPFMFYTINQATVSWWQTLLIALGGAFTAPIFSLFYAVFAENKVAGFAYSKFGGVAGMFIMASWFVPQPFQWLFGLFPPWWISKAYWMALAGESGWWLALIAGIFLQLLLIQWLVQRFQKVVYS